MAERQDMARAEALSVFCRVETIWRGMKRGGKGLQVTSVESEQLANRRNTASWRRYFLAYHEPPTLTINRVPVK